MTKIRRASDPVLLLDPPDPIKVDPRSPPPFELQLKIRLSDDQSRRRVPSSNCLRPPPPHPPWPELLDEANLWVLRLQARHMYCLLGRLSSEVGWNHYDTIKELENKRKESLM